MSGYSPPPADALWASCYPDGPPVVIDLFDLLEHGQSGGLHFGVSILAQLERVLGEPRVRHEQQAGALLLQYAYGEVVSLEGGVLRAVSFDCHPHYGRLEEQSVSATEHGYDAVGLTELWYGAAGASLRLAGRSVSYFSTFAKLIHYRPSGLAFDLDARAGPLDKRIRAATKRGSREIELVYELTAFEVGQHKGRMYFDYCLASVSASDRQVRDKEL